MRSRSDTWAAIAGTGKFRMESVAVIGGTEYSSITAPIINRGLVSDDLSVGNCIAASLEVSVLTDDTIANGAEVVIKSRITDETTYSEWLEFGTFYINTRDVDAETGLLTLDCYDAMLKGNVNYYDSSDSQDRIGWPKAMTDVVDEIALNLGVELDDRTSIKTGDTYVCAYPDGLTMLEVLGYIGACHGGNWIITPENKLRLVPLVSPADEAFNIIDYDGNAIITGDGSRLVYRQTTDSGIEDEHPAGGGLLDVPVVIDQITTGESVQITQIILPKNSEKSYMSGTGGGYTLTLADNPYACQSICDDLLDEIGSIIYAPFTAENCCYDPCAELGDWVLAGDMVCGVLFVETATHGINFRADISAPSSEEAGNEYPYLSEIQKLKNQAASLTAYVDDMEAEFTSAIEQNYTSIVSYVDAEVTNLQHDYITDGDFADGGTDWELDSGCVIYSAGDISLWEDTAVLYIPAGKSVSIELGALPVEDLTLSYAFSPVSSSSASVEIIKYKLESESAALGGNYASVPTAEEITTVEDTVSITAEDEYTLTLTAGVNLYLTNISLLGRTDNYASALIKQEIEVLDGEIISSIELTATVDETSADKTATLNLKATTNGGSEITAEAAEIKFTGLVTFTNLAENTGETIINGGNIKTGTLTTDQIVMGGDTDSDNVTKYIADMGDALLLEVSRQANHDYITDGDFANGGTDWELDSGCVIYSAGDISLWEDTAVLYIPAGCSAYIDLGALPEEDLTISCEVSPVSEMTYAMVMFAANLVSESGTSWTVLRAMGARSVGAETESATVSVTAAGNYTLQLYASQNSPGVYVTNVSLLGKTDNYVLSQIELASDSILLEVSKTYETQENVANLELSLTELTAEVSERTYYEFVTDGEFSDYSSNWSVTKSSGDTFTVSTDSTDYGYIVNLLGVSSSSYPMLSQSIGTLPAGTYTVSCYARTDSGYEDTAQITIGLGEGAAELAITSTELTYISGTITISDSIDDATISVYIGVKNVPIYFTDVSVTALLGTYTGAMFSIAKDKIEACVEADEVRTAFSMDSTDIELSAEYGKITFNAGTLVINSSYLTLSESGAFAIGNDSSNVSMGEDGTLTIDCTNFGINSNGDVNITGTINMTGGSITWSEINESDSAAFKNAQSAVSQAKDAASDASSALSTAEKIADGTYSGSGTFINGKSIYSPTIYANKFDVISRDGWNAGDGFRIYDSDGKTNPFYLAWYDTYMSFGSGADLSAYWAFSSTSIDGNITLNKKILLNSSDSYGSSLPSSGTAGQLFFLTS